MSTTEILTASESGNLTLPPEIVERYQSNKEMQFRIIETQKGVLLIPLSNEPMNPALRAEVAEWQQHASESWASFAYEDFDS